MPKLSDDEVKAKIAEGSISALTIDTNVFDKYGCNPDFAIFRRLDQFAGSAVAVLFSEIIVREVMRHIEEEAAETQRALKKALSAHGKRWKIDPAAVAPVASYRPALNSRPSRSRQRYKASIGRQPERQS